MCRMWDTVVVWENIKGGCAFESLLVWGNTSCNNHLQIPESYFELHFISKVSNNESSPTAIMEEAALHCKYGFMVAQTIYFVPQCFKNPLFAHVKGVKILPESSQNSKVSVSVFFFVLQMLSTWTSSPPWESSTTCSPTTKTQNELSQFH